MHHIIEKNNWLAHMGPDKSVWGTGTYETAAGLAEWRLFKRPVRRTHSRRVSPDECCWGQRQLLS